MALWSQALRQTLTNSDNDSHITLPFVFQQQEQDPTNLYLSNLPVSMDEQELENLLKPFGQVISTRILRDAHGMSRGVGFARSARLIIYLFRFFFLPSHPSSHHLDLCESVYSGSAMYAFNPGQRQLFCVCVLR